MRSLPLASINSGFLPYWRCRFSLLHCIATSTSPKHTSYIPSSCLSPLCYSLHKHLATYSHQQNLPLIRWVFSLLSHIPLNFLGLSTKHKDKSTSQAQNCFFLLYDGPTADVARLKSGLEWPRGSVWTTCPVILEGNLALPLHLSLCSLAISSSLTSSSFSPTILFWLLLKSTVMKERQTRVKN